MKTKFAVLAVVSLASLLFFAGAPGCSANKAGPNGPVDGPGDGAAGGGDAGASGGQSGGAAGLATGGTSGGTGGGGKGGTGGMVSEPGCASPPKLKLTRVTTAAEPMALVQAQDDERMFVAERAGRIRILRNGKFDPMPFFDMSMQSVLNAPITGVHERGLLNLALHPNFPTDRRFYVFYTRRADDPQSQGQEGAIVIAEGRQDGQSDKAESALKVLTTVDVPEDHHLGGFLAFGKDGLLYAGIGDGGGGIDKSGAGQDPTRRLSKILRIDVDDPSKRADGNLDAAGADPLSWAYGVRNPFRGSFDRLTGDLYFGDVGESSYEEVNFVPPGQMNLNFGWGFDPSQREGQHQKQTGMEGLHPVPWYTAVEWKPFGYLPVHEYPHDGPGWTSSPTSWQQKGFSCGAGINGACSRAVMGGRVYRGQAIPELQGRYLFGDHVRNWVMSFIMKDGKATCYLDLTEDLVTPQTRLQGLNNFAEDANGELYVTDLAAGNIYKIEKE